MFASDIQRLALAAEAAEHASSDFDLNADVRLNPDRKLRPAAVAILVQDHPNGSRVLLTKRPSSMKHHPGQIAFPGGKADPTDPDIFRTALREAEEEVGLIASQATLVGVLRPHETVTQFQIHPHIMKVDATFHPNPHAEEVAEAFWVPLSHLMQTASYQIQSRRWRGARRYYYAVPYGPYYIWGATARILFSLAQSTER